METAASLLLRAIGGDRLKYKYNEAVADGFLPCAPDTSQGAGRKFDQWDAVGAEIFGLLIDFGFNARRAGALTCAAVDLMRAHKGRRPPIGKILITNEGGKATAVAVTHYKQQVESTAPVLIELNLVTILSKINDLVASLHAEVCDREEVA
jgi:hypothetical protein